jgi:hypothetical protein
MISASLLILSPIISQGSAAPVGGAIASAWRDRDVKIDGLNTEWQEWSPLGQEFRYSIGLLNDDEDLYVALRTSDPATSVQMLTQGLIVWFDAEGGTKKRFGLKYPVGALSYGTPDSGPGRGGRGGPPRGQGRSGGQASPDQLWAQAEADGRLSRLELLGPGSDDRRSLVMGKTDPIAVRVGWQEGVVLYELRIPIAKGGNRQYTLGVAPGRTIGIGLENAEREPGPGLMRFGAGPGGVGGGPGGGSGAPGGVGGGPGQEGGSGGPGRGAERPKAPKPLNAWVTVRLSANRDAR